MNHQQLKERIKALGHTLYCDGDVLKNAPMGITGELEFFTLRKYISDDDLVHEYASRGLTPATLEDLIAFDENSQSKMDEMLNVATHFKDADGNWCFVAFGRWDGGRSVSVGRGDGDDWSGRWWFGGVSKSSELEKSDLLETQSFEAGENLKKGDEVECEYMGKKIKAKVIKIL